MALTGLSEDEIKNIAWHSASFELDVSNLLSAKAFDIISWKDSPDLLLKQKPSENDRKKRQGWGLRFWLTRFALAAHLTIDTEARLSAAAARAWGARWSDVGETIGITAQGAQQRYRS